MSRAREQRSTRADKALASHDLCVGCEGKVAHDPSHAFAVFKQPVSLHACPLHRCVRLTDTLCQLDLDLFKSAIDLSADSGAARPLLPFRIV